MAEARKLWTREELILALNLYLKLDFGKISWSNPKIIHLAKILGRTPSSISMRLSNFASVDPYHQNRGVGGLKGGIKQVQPIWDEFNANREDSLFESEKILAAKENKTIEAKYSEILIGIENLVGETKIREVKTRVNQNIFRMIVLANYNNTCAITGINNSELLIASHIISWALNKEERLNPRNGICLNALHDKAFDKGLITITTDYKVRLSPLLLKQSTSEPIREYFIKYENKKIAEPVKYKAHTEFLKFHNQECFKS